MIQTERLLLRRPALMDLDAMTGMWTDAAIARTMDDFGPRDPEAVRHWLDAVVADASPDTNLQLTMVRRVGGVPVGWVGLGASSRGVAEWSFGYAVHPAHRGRGYAAEALAAAIVHCRRALGIESLWGECHPDNPASAHVMLAAGLTEIDPGPDGQRRFRTSPHPAVE